MSFIEDAAEAALHSALKPIRSRGAFLCAFIRKAGEMLAESDGDDAAAAQMASRARIHAERASRMGVQRARGR